MSNLHQLTTTGSVLSLGPVTVTKAFNKFAGSSSVLILVSDPSVSEAKALKIWGPASNTVFTEGQQLTFQGQGPKGKVEWKEYKGKWEGNVNDCAVIVGDGGQPAQQYAAQAAPQSAPAASAGYQPRAAAPTHSGGGEQAHPQTLSWEEGEARMKTYAARQALFQRILVDELTLNHGFPVEQALILAGGGGSGLYAQSWFLNKGF